MSEEEYFFWLCNTPGIGAVKIRKLLEYFAFAQNVAVCNEETLVKSGMLTAKQLQSLIEHKKNIGKITEQYHKLKDNGIRFITARDKEYPLNLLEIYDYPMGLYVKGKLPDCEEKSVAIIGARDCSHYGSEIAANLASELAQLGINIIGGLAQGIDTCGHVGALQGGGNTYAVLGSGVDVCYPITNWNLYLEIMENGGIISEFPVGSEPIASHFPMRNRIISGLADAVIIVEAKEKSGSLITANFALEQGREIFTVPGRITDCRSRGCNALLKQGASLLQGVEDVVKFLYPKYKIVPSKNKNNQLGLALKEEKVYSCLDLHSVSTAEIVEETGYELAEVMEILLQLESSGIVVQTATNYYAAKFR